MRIIIETDWERPAVNRRRATEEHIRENQRLNRLQREKEERAAQNNNSESNDGQDSENR